MPSTSKTSKSSTSVKDTHTSGLFFQPKLQVNEPGDRYEQEADASAERIMRRPVSQTSNAGFFSAAPIQRHSGTGIAPEPSPAVSDTLQSQGQAMDKGTRGFMESRFGQDFGQVQIHNDALAHQSSADLQAKAYTHENHIAFGSGQYQPETDSGKQLLAHELTHVLQQRGSGGEKISRDPAPPKPDPSKEMFVHNTELGGLNMGNFDFHFKDCAVLVWVWVKFKFTKEITADEQAAFKTRFVNAIHNVWAHSGYSIAGSAKCPCPNVPIEIHVQENATGHYHKLVDVEKKTDRQRRPNVMSDININLYSDDSTIAHEFGHVLGLYDEYDGGFFENIMFWHKNQNDPRAIMSQDWQKVPKDQQTAVSQSTELRPRYFEQYRRTLQSKAPNDCKYTVSSPTPPVP